MVHIRTLKMRMYFDALQEQTVYRKLFLQQTWCTLSHFRMKIDKKFVQNRIKPAQERQKQHVVKQLCVLPACMSSRTVIHERDEADNENGEPKDNIQVISNL